MAARSIKLRSGLLVVISLINERKNGIGFTQLMNTFEFIVLVPHQYLPSRKHARLHLEICTIAGGVV